MKISCFKYLLFYIVNIIFLSSCFLTQPKDPLVAPDHPMIRYTGRIAWHTTTRPDNKPWKNAVFAWSATQVEFAFKGTTCEIKLQNQDPLGAYKCPYNVLSVYIDNLEPLEFTLDTSMRSFPVATNLQAGVHTVKIIKRTEAGCGTVHFGGINLPDGELVQLPYPRPNRRVVFIGNSITCGYGIADSVPTNPFLPEREDWLRTYAAYVTRALEAEAEVICASGHGMWRNYDGTTTGTVPSLFPLVSPQTGDRHTETQPEPVAVFINLGTNDFAKGVPDSAAFVGSYVAFLQQLRGRYPHALIVCLDGGMFFSKRPVDKRTGIPYVRTLRAWRDRAIAAAGSPRIMSYDLPEPTWPLRGAGNHPDAWQHLRYGEALGEWVKKQVNPQ